MVSNDEQAGEAIGADISGSRMLDAYDRIKLAILRGAFAPGARLSQVKIAESLGLSRTPVREALRLIEKEGLVSSRRGRQVVISTTSMADLDELYALRIKLDTSTVRTSVADLDGADMDEMRDCLARMEQFASPENFAEFDAAHRTFHMIAIRGAGPRHVEYSAKLNEHAERYRRIYLGQSNSYEQSSAEHRAILAACDARDGGLVSYLLAEHYARIALTIIAQIEPQFEPRLVRAAARVALDGKEGPTRKSETEKMAARSGEGF
ncbi:GntR family transcriptional regulator [Roseisalinus antarcticus]|uniref:HTH-type transcriptional repressor CsiR n=1 Tax=Roseisalinus antarcticus TaxID=254357 RepID=A0A1Y5TUY9_9RHOB|nr:GntR family transcriptional regulator [Roseisalinus antarcticus]SLN73689.1 HTH-type transcriptional repressor CsiR [Roseisalinus antarcticus]